MMRLPRMAAALAGAAAILTGCSNMKQIKHMPYPRTERTDVTDNYFGTEVPDPYRWLEDDNSEATAAWVKAQNVVTQDYLSQIPFRGAIRERLTELWNYPKEGIPAKHGDAWYYFYNDGLRNQSVLYRTAQPGGEGEVFIDPNTLSEDGTVALSGVTFSKDGKYCAYSVAASGSDWVEIRVMNTADRTLTSDRINWVKFSGAEWAPDSKGFYYSAYDAPQKGVFSSQNQFQKVYYHRLGTPQSADWLIYADAEHPLRYFSPWPSKDGQWLFIVASEGTSGTEVLYKKVSEPKFRTLLPGFDADYAPVECRDGQLYYVTNRDASNYALMKVDLNDPSKVSTVIPESGGKLLEGVGSAGGYLFATYLEHAQSKVCQYGFDGKLVREVELPAIGTVSGFDGGNPCYLYAYGGFQINQTPAFRPSAMMFVEQGGIYCVANLRGGSEYGEAWHKAGMLENKQNVFDDFIAAAEYLIAEKYTSSDKLAIAGGSNGGLLVGACEVQRPDLYAVCLPAVGVMDMLRYHKFTIGWGWAVEYGSSENGEQFDYIYKYSPLHNIREGVKYPATLVTTADHDDRVVPAHSFKFAAQMQHCQAGDAPVLIRIESNAGHGAGKPTSKRIAEEADTYSFLFQNIGVPYKEVKKQK